MQAPELWNRSVAILSDVLGKSGEQYEAAEGEAAFYGPKIDVQVLDNAGREFTLSTVQVDFYQPEQFDLEYIGADGARHRPVMVHRSIVGSVERAVAHLIEEHGGAFPAWLVPVQIVVLPLTDDEDAAAERFFRKCMNVGLRAEVHGAERGSLGARIRGAHLAPFQAVIGPKEAAIDHVALRLRDGRRVEAEPAEKALSRIADAAAAVL